MNKEIQSLQRGDTISIIAPAKAIEKQYIDFAVTYFESHGFKVLLGHNVSGRHNYFSGTDEERLSDFQQALDNPDVKAIICARGGYGAIRILDRINWAVQLREPKWIVGFSDITIFHQRMLRFGIESIHGSMPLNFMSNSKESFDTLMCALTKKEYSIECEYNENNKLGNCQGNLVGGNLSILYSLLGTDDEIDYTGCILFIEDIGEQLYSLDRMLFSFKKAGILDRVSGLIIGGMTSLSDTNPPSGLILEQIILQHFEYSKTPVCFGFPAGHVDDNRALVFGKTVELNVSTEKTELIFPSEHSKNGLLS
jgi:muramoyltetrapeptide carboxypeptidase